MCGVHRSPSHQLEVDRTQVRKLSHLLYQTPLTLNLVSSSAQSCLIFRVKGALPDSLLRIVARPPLNPHASVRRSSCLPQAPHVGAKHSLWGYEDSVSGSQRVSLGGRDTCVSGAQRSRHVAGLSMPEESNVEIAWDAKHHTKGTEHDQILISSQSCRRRGRHPRTDRGVTPNSSLAQVSDDKGQAKVAISLPVELSRTSLCLGIACKSKHGAIYTVQR